MRIKYVLNAKFMRFFTDFFRERGNYKPTETCEETENKIMFCMNHKFDSEKKEFSEMEGIRSGIRDYYKNVLKYEDS